MDQTERQLQSLGICQRLFNFIMNILAGQALKPVTLGPPMHHASLNRVGSMCKQSVHPVAQGTLCEGAGSRAKVELEQAKALENRTHVGTFTSPRNDQAQARAPKKSVGINDRAEVIESSKKNREKNIATKKFTSMEREKDEPKPLKSILKVGSNLNEKSNSFNDRTGKLQTRKDEL